MSLPPSKNVTVQFTRLEIKNDQDGWLEGAGDIYIRYTINNGDAAAAQGTLPGVEPNGDPLYWELNDGEATNDLGGGPHARFSTNTSQITVQASVWDDDDTFTGNDDHLREDVKMTFFRGDGYGAGPHTANMTDYKLSFTVTVVDA